MYEESASRLELAAVSDLDGNGTNDIRSDAHVIHFRPGKMRGDVWRGLGGGGTSENLSSSELAECWTSGSAAQALHVSRALGRVGGEMVPGLQNSSNNGDILQRRS